MDRLSLDRCHVVVATSSEAKELPVKNTFIHFPNDCTDFKIGCVQRFKTDPSSEPRARSRLSSLDDDEATDVPSTSTSGGSTPRTSTDESSLVPSSSLPMPVAAQASQATQWSSSFIKLDNGIVHFRCMLRRAESVEWGLDVTPLESMIECGIEQALVVDEVLQGGAIEAWNRQVIDGPKADRAIQVGDFILSINCKRDCQAMVSESNREVLLEMEVLRQSPQP